MHSGESYEQAAYRELKEEIGVDSPLTLLWKDKYDPKDGAVFRFLTSYKSVHDGPFIVDPEEVAAVEYFTMSEIQHLITAGTLFHPETLFLLRQHFDIS